MRQGGRERCGGAAVAVALLRGGAGAAWRGAQDAATERRQAFVLADVNGDGCLQLAELAREMVWRFAALDTRSRPAARERDELVIADGCAVRPHRPRRRRQASAFSR